MMDHRGEMLVTGQVKGESFAQDGNRAVATGLVSGIPNEAQLQPSMWGAWVVEPLKIAPAP